MEKNQVIITKDRGLISISGEDSKDFLQNLISNDINKTDNENAIFSGIFTPQGKYLFEFFVLKNNEQFFLECYENDITDLIAFLKKFKLRSKITIENLSTEYGVAIISNEKFKDLRSELNSRGNVISFRDSPIFLDPRSNNLGARIISTTEKLYLSIKKLGLKTTDGESYVNKAHEQGIPVTNLNHLRDQLFGIEANFEELNGIDFKKGCYIGQENTSRMKLRGKIRRKLLPVTIIEDDNDQEIKLENNTIGKILIKKPKTFALIKLFDPDINSFANKEIQAGNKKLIINYPKLLNS